MNREEVIRGLIQNIFYYTKVKLTKTAIQKILYQLRTELPEGHEVRTYLPYYWYNHGPFSETVGSVIEGMKNTNSLVEEEDRNGYSLLSLSNTNQLNNSSIYFDVNEKLNEIVQSINVYRLDLFVDKIYRENAPYEFMPMYKLDFLKSLDDIVYHITYSESSPHINRLENVLFDCEVALVEDPLFKDYNQKFSKFVTSMERSFDLMRDGESCSKTLVQIVQKPAEEVWYTFAHGVRILDPAHDQYYNDKIPSWNISFKTYLDDMITLVNEFSKISLNYHLLAPKTPHPPDPKTRTILSSIVNGYLS